MQAVTGIAKKPRKQAISSRFWAGRTYRGRIKDDHKIDRELAAEHLKNIVYEWELVPIRSLEYIMIQKESREKIGRCHILIVHLGSIERSGYREVKV